MAIEADCEVLSITKKQSPLYFDYETAWWLKYCVSLISDHFTLYFDYKTDDCSVRWSSSVKHLGIYINSKLNWNNHCTNVAAKATYKDS